jgi:hypothetical protein
MTRVFTEDLREQSMDARAQCEEMRVRPMGTENPIGRAKMVGNPDRDRFLSDAEMDGTAD